jgi:hypothetical protein
MCRLIKFYDPILLIFGITIAVYKVLEYIVHFYFLLYYKTYDLELLEKYSEPTFKALVISFLVDLAIFHNSLFYTSNV